MLIALTGGASSTDKIVRQAQQTEADGFTSVWCASTVASDPLPALGGRQRHLDDRARNRCAADLSLLAAVVAEPIGRGGFTLGLGPLREVRSP